MRLQSPAISFKISGVLKSANIPASHDPYLPSGSAAPPNLLDALDVNLKHGGFEARIPALSHSFTSTPFSNPAFKDVMLKVCSSSIFRAIPALSARIRYSPTRGHIGKPSVIASLDIETATYLNTDLTITAVHMSLFDGEVQDLSTKAGIRFPLRCRPKDNLIFLFELLLKEGVFGAPSSSRTLNIEIEADVMASQSYHPRIHMHWITAVDFSSGTAPTYGASNQSFQPSKLPPGFSAMVSQSNVSSAVGTSQVIKTVPDSSKKEPASTPDPDITITFTAPRGISVGVPFQLDLSIINQSSKPRHLAISAIPKSKPGDTKRHVTKSSSSSFGGRKDAPITEAIMDENIVYATQRSTGMESSRLIPLSNDLRTGYMRFSPFALDFIFANLGAAH